MLSETKHMEPLFKDFIEFDEIPDSFTNYIKAEVINKIKKGRYVAIVVSKCYAGYTQEQLEYLTKNNDVYRNTSL
jgi:hypothetical protein